MDLLGMLSAWLDSHRWPQNDPARQNLATRDSLLRLTLLFGRRRLRLEIEGLTRTDTAERVSAAAESVPSPRGEAGNGPHRSAPPRTDDWQEARTSPGSRAQIGQTAGEEARRLGSTAISFWDALDPTEREALRSVASWRTFAAGATLMREGERADHVLVILGGRTRISVDENGSERVLAEPNAARLR